MTKRKVRLARLTVADKTMVCPLILCIMLILSFASCSLLFGFGTARGEMPCSASVEVGEGGWSSPQPLN